MALAGRVVVITGGSAGIGKALAENISAKGACVVLAARREPQLREVVALCGGDDRALAVVADVTQRNAHQLILDKAIAKFGKVCIQFIFYTDKI